ncbi:MAG: hypothetical protein KGH60_03035 [Candidatus Micrarchaeota archaeon]|nr:hypothetical protein [Candidatus Micrarchaeota archaeon]
MSEATLKMSNAGTEIEINLANQQLFSLKRNGVEVMWPGGAPESRRPKTGWPNSEIVMFPIIGAAPNDKIRIGDKEYPMGQHGIARYIPWRIIDPGTFSVNMVQYHYGQEEIRGKNKQISVFPEPYRLAKTYFLSESGDLCFKIDVSSESDNNLHFALGFHPAFLVPNGAGAVANRSSNDSTTLRLSEVRKAEGCAMRFEDSRAIEYLTDSFKVTMTHNFGMTQVWDKGEGYVAIEPITAPSLSATRQPDAELGAMPRYITLRGHGHMSFFGTIKVEPLDIRK